MGKVNHIFQMFDVNRFPLVVRRKIVTMALFGELVMTCMQFGSAFIFDDIAGKFLFAPLVDFVFEVFPVLHGYQSESAFPEATIFYFLLSIILFPLQLLLFVVLNYVAAFSGELNKLPLKIVLSLVLSASIVAISLFVLPKDPGFSGWLGMNSSRLGLAFFGTGQFFILWLAAGLLISEILFFCKGSLK